MVYFWSDLPLIYTVWSYFGTSEQALYRLLRLFLSQSALTPLLLLFSRDPLALGSRLMMRMVRIFIA